MMTKYIFILLFPITILAQTVDCGQVRRLSVWEGEWKAARGVMPEDADWKFATKHTYDNNNAGFSDFGQVSTLDPDTIYYLGRRPVYYLDILGQRVFYENSVFDEETGQISRSILAAIPNATNENECPDTSTVGFFLFYDKDGNARYRQYGEILSYSHPIDPVDRITEEIIEKKSCQTIRAGKTIVAEKKRKNITFRRGYCTEANVNKKDQIEILKGKVIEYKGCAIENDIITFKGDADFKITFEQGKVKLKKLEGGGKLDFISNANWQ